MRSIPLLTLLLYCTIARAQTNEIGWIAPEGKIINYRTLSWNDFQQHEDKEYADKLKEKNLYAEAYVCPAIYFKADSGETQDNGRVKFKFHVKCAFQSSAFVRESTKQKHSNYVLVHEQDHYDIALNYANKLQDDLSSRDYSATNYNEEINKIYEDLYKNYRAMQEKYDGEVNPDGRDEVEKQQLWDMRIKKCLENNTIEYYASPESAVQNVKSWGQTVKRRTGEDKRRFITRARPIYTEVTDELAGQSVATSEWTTEQSIVAFYLQKYYLEQEGKPVKDCSRLLAYIFIPNGTGTYKRSFIDTFCFNDIAPKINTVFFANADSDQVKELVILTTADQKDKQASGRHYFTKCYDNIPGRALPGRLKKVNNLPYLENGFDGTMDGKLQKAKFKNEKEITDELKKAGYTG